MGCWRHALSGLRVGAGTELLAAVSAARYRVIGPPLDASRDVAVTSAILYGTLRHEALLIARDGGFQLLGSAWGWSNDQVASAGRTVAAVIGASPAQLVDCYSSLPGGLGQPCAFPHLSMLAHVVISSGLSWDLALPSLARFYWGRFDSAGSQFWCTRPDGRLLADVSLHPWQSLYIGARTDDDPSIILLLQDNIIIAVLASESLRPSAARARERSSSRFLPSYIRLPKDEEGNLIFSTIRVTSLIENREAWSRIIGNVDGVTWAILSGRLVYPRVSWLLKGSWLRNHPSYESPEVKDVLGLKTAVYLVQGALEWVAPWCRVPLYIEPVGAVVKPGPDKFRMISDARHGNKGLEHWGVRYHTALDFAATLDHSFFSHVDDVQEGYHLSVLQGCTEELVWAYGVIGFEPDPDGAGQRPSWGMRLHVGCSPDSCLMVCDKSANGVCSDGCIMRWAVAHFGQGPAGSPLNCIALCLLRHMARRSSNRFEAAAAVARTSSAVPPAEVMSLDASPVTGTQGVVWVDDFAFSCRVPYHVPCSGADAGCETCLAALPAAQESRRYWHALCPALGVPLHPGKSQACTQRPEFAGFMHDTVRGLRLILPKKLEKLLDSVLTLACAEEASARMVDQVRGRVLHYSACVKHLRVSCASLSLALGTDQQVEYDFRVNVDQELRATCCHMVDVIFQYGSAGCDLWPLPPSTMLARFMDGTLTEAIALLTWDAAPGGWAALVRWWDSVEEGKFMREQLLVGTWPPEAEVSEQSHREAWGGCLALEASARVTNIQSSAVLMRNDASAAISALRKGSFGSPALQRVAVRADRFCSKLDIDLHCMHVPGLVLIEEGIDGASRDGCAFGDEANVESIRGVSVSDRLWDIIQSVADRLSWKLTIDLFATASNHRTDRFISRWPEPDAESFDSFLAPSWRESRCPLCGLSHREAVYAFPPPALLREVVAKALADRAVGIFVTPVVVTSPVWQKLRQASILSDPEGYVRIRRARRLLTGPFAHSDLAIFACDFGRLRGAAEGWSDPGCAGAFRPRPRPVCGSPADAADRRRLRAAIPHVVRGKK